MFAVIERGGPRSKATPVPRRPEIPAQGRDDGFAGAAWGVVLLLALILLLPAAGALAQPLPPGVPAVDADGRICSVGGGIAERIVLCIRNNIVWATANFLLPFSEVFSHMVRIVCTLAVIFFGVNLILARRQRILIDSYILVIKLGAVITYTWNFGGLFPQVLDVLDWLVNTVSAYTQYDLTLACPMTQNVWQRVDCTLDRLIGGLLPGSALSSGILGFLFGSIFSGAAGFSLFLIGLSFVMTMVTILCKACYIYLSAFLALALLVIISPMVIPTILFRATKAYFEKWLRLMLAMILQPIFLFAYLSLLMAAFDVVVFSGPNSLYSVLAGERQVAAPGFRIGKYMIASGAYEERAQFPLSANLHSPELSKKKETDLVQTGMWGKLGRWAKNLDDEHKLMIGKNVGVDFPTPGVNMRRLAMLRLGCPPPEADEKDDSPAARACYTQYIVRVSMALLMAAIIAYIFFLMLQFVPYLGSGTSRDDTFSPRMLGEGAFGSKGLSKFRDQLAPRPAPLVERGKPAGGASK